MAIVNRRTNSILHILLLLTALIYGKNYKDKNTTKGMAKHIFLLNKRKSIDALTVIFGEWTWHVSSWNTTFKIDIIKLRHAFYLRNAIYILYVCTIWGVRPHFILLHAFLAQGMNERNYMKKSNLTCFFRRCPVLFNLGTYKTNWAKFRLDSLKNYVINKYTFTSIIAQHLDPIALHYLIIP